MWTIITGYILMISSIGLMVNPDRLRRKLKKKAKRTVRRFLFAVAAGVGGLLISAVWGQEGLTPKFLAGIGVVMIIKSIFLLTGKSGDAAAEWLLKVPAIWLRVYAVVQFGIGFFLVKM